MSDGLRKYDDMTYVGARQHGADAIGTSIGAAGCLNCRAFLDRHLDHQSAGQHDRRAVPGRPVAG